MLILRVAEGNAWQKDTIRAPTSVIRFSPSYGDMSGSSSSRFGGSEAVVKYPESEKHSDKV